MTEDFIGPYDVGDWRWAVNLSALLGWSSVVLPIAVLGNPMVVLYAALIGLPIAFVSCWLIVAPILRRVMKRKVTWMRAVAWGAVIGGVIEIIGIAIARVKGLIDSTNDNFNYVTGNGDNVQNIDGILTAYGWWVQAQHFLFNVAIAVVVAAIIRAIIGPGHPKRKFA